MVTVPVMGAEWGKTELYDMTKSGKQAKVAEARRQKARAFLRGEKGCCGIPWLNRKFWVIFIFVACFLVIA